MRISTRGRYGLRILLDLALHEKSEPRLIRDIAASQQISEKYISRLIVELRRAGMVRSIRGAKGGFRLAENPAELTVLEVVEVMEGPLAIVGCLGAPGKCGRDAGCAVRGIWERLNGEIRGAMSRITLADILEEQRRSAASGVLDYCI